MSKVVMGSDRHLAADEVLGMMRRRCPSISLATTYNTLNLFVQKGLLDTQVLKA
ncbi:MAG: hypothetical protein GXY44_06280 [Phycisphaerales bacterium]|nr:hypothetical protein [Phycisphaerales bacterium]